MKSSFLLVLATSLFLVAVWFFGLSGEFLTSKDYLAGVLHVFVGLATVRGGVELARLAVVLHLRSRGG